MTTRAPAVLKMMNFMKMRTSYKKLPLFTKNSTLHTYKKLKPQIRALQKTPFLELIETPGGVAALPRWCVTLPPLVCYQYH